MILTAPKSYHPIHRLNGSPSRQPRFNEVSTSKFFTSIYRFFCNPDIRDMPDYGDHKRSEYLRRFWKMEPYLSGVLNSVTSIDKNRGWTITGGRNQVKRFVDVLHNRFYFAPDLTGWRQSFGGSALSYYTSDLGSVTEIGRQGKQGPLDSLYFVDPSRCYLTGSNDYPLAYTPTGGNRQLWELDDYFRIVSMPDTNEATYGLGFCALSRCFELAKIMVGIYAYDNEMLLNHAPRGLLLLKGITQDQWEDALESREARLQSNEYKYYGAVEVLAAQDPGVEIEAQLTALSSLPAEFDQRTFTDLLMYGYALCFGYDPREFWPVSSGALGTATETEQQHRKAGGKGGLDFVLGFAEKMQSELPDTLEFEFEERDFDAEMSNAQAELAQADVVNSLYDAGMGIVGREEARILAAEKGLIDPEWTISEEETVATDTDDVERVLQSERVQRAMWKYRDEPIVRYRFSVENGKERHDYRTIVKPIILKRSFLITRLVKRQIDQELNDYLAQLTDLASQVISGDLTSTEFQQELDALTVAILTLAIVSGLDTQSESASLLKDAAELILENGYDPDLLETLLTDELLSDALPAQAKSLLEQEIEVSLNSSLASEVGGYINDPYNLGLRLEMWRNTARGLEQYGRLVANPDKQFTWHLGQTEAHCDTCRGLNGQTKTGQEWLDSGYYPASRNLDCNGYHCDCRIEGP